MVAADLLIKPGEGRFFRGPVDGVEGVWPQAMISMSGVRKGLHADHGSEDRDGRP